MTTNTKRERFMAVITEEEANPSHHSFDSLVFSNFGRGKNKKLIAGL